ncbi:MAG: hypothetical protein ACO1G7_08735 [Bacteroidota bacterium]|jgi:hypothetical protein|nr:hypothetical protein [Bacteroidia bacterium]MBP7269001.1 hypothetical protein [Bacteroidia bacterium]MBP7436443.1 hypothetical protein [Bacteroidia bacterium]MBP7728236.1 hypothetical protein [Bacteroidia bacterium]MBP7771417.1 hypothetical protein [Bacteroidia bacterium]
MNSRAFQFIATFLTCMLCLIGKQALAQSIAGVSAPPQMLNYQAVARDASGNALLSTAISLRFTIHSVSASGPIEYQETQSVTTNQFGLFSVQIGTGTVVSGIFPLIDWVSADFFLQVEVDPTGGSSWIDMGAAQLISVPYSFVSKQSLISLDNHWVQNGPNLYNEPLGKVGIGTSTPLYKLHVESDNSSSLTGVVHAQATHPTGSNLDVSAFYGISDVDDYFGLGGTFYGGWKGVYGSVSPSGTGTYYGVNGSVYGGSGYNYGVYGESDQVGVYGDASGNGNGLTWIYGPSYDETAGLYGYASLNNNTNGISYGVVGESFGSSSNNNAGVFGYAANATGTSPRNWGVYGLSKDAVSAAGVLGVADGSGNSGHGVEGDALSGSNQIGVFGYAAGTTGSDYAGYFLGQLYATTASSGIKAFKIDHPLDPENKYLFHSSVESDEMLNQYSGNVTTDGQGLATVQLPDYFEALNKDIRYQLTVIGQFAQAIVQEEVSGNRFSIRTDKPNVRVSWLVMGIRKDPLANQYRIQPVVDKPASEKGTYLVPQVYGKSIDRAPHQPTFLPYGNGNRKVMKPMDDPKRKK